jgi:hypothetical protein
MAFEHLSANNGTDMQFRTSLELIPFYEQAGVIMQHAGFSSTTVALYERHTGSRDLLSSVAGYRMFVETPHPNHQVLEEIVVAGVAMANYLMSQGIYGCNERLIVEQAMRIEAIKQGGVISEFPKNSA